MDSHGARLLLARIKAGVPVGTRIELVRDPDDESGLCAGDRGVVHGIGADGRIHVVWDRGIAVDIDPARTPIRPLAA